MDTKTKIYLIIALVAVALIIVWLMRRNALKAEVEKLAEALNVRFNSIKTVPLAFKLNKAQAMAKRSKETSEQVKEYYERYELAQKRIDEIAELFESFDDAQSLKHHNEALALGKELTAKIDESEAEVKAIDAFLEQFSLKENQQREFSARLKEEYRQLKNWVNDNAPQFSIAYEGVCHRLEKCEELFSSSEEWMYANDYVHAQDDLGAIETSIKELKASLPLIPTYVKDIKGVLPVMLDELERQYALSRQRGIYTEHLKIDEALMEFKSRQNEKQKVLMDGEITGVGEELAALKTSASELLKCLEDENKAYLQLKDLSARFSEKLNELKRVTNYVSIAFAKEKERYSLGNLDEYLNVLDTNIKGYGADYLSLNDSCLSNDEPSSQLLTRFKDLNERLEADLEKIVDYKKKIDKNSSDEERAKNQLMKMQIVLNEVEVKVREYRLPAIASSYNEDLLKGREQIAQIKNLLKEIPLNIDLLNTTLEETISYIYTFYNNVNNVVGMAIMVEDAIVLGNKYRSTHIEVDRDLSKAEFSYLNGEYTKAFRIAISCMESLFPSKADEKLRGSSDV